MSTSASLRVAAIAVVFLVLHSLPARAQDVALTPPMGWNSWNYFAEKVDDQGVRAAADAIAASGMRDAGYVYVNIDDTWEGQRDSNACCTPTRSFLT